MVTKPLMLFTNAVYTYSKLSDNFYSSSSWIQGPTFLSSQSTLNSSLPFRISWFLCFLLLLWCWHLLFNWHQFFIFLDLSLWAFLSSLCSLTLNDCVYTFGFKCPLYDADIQGVSSALPPPQTLRCKYSSMHLTEPLGHSVTLQPLDLPFLSVLYFKKCHSAQRKQLP